MPLLEAPDHGCIWMETTAKKLSDLNYFKGGGKKEETGTEEEESEEVREKNRNGDIKRSKETSGNVHIKDLLHLQGAETSTGRRYKGGIKSRAMVTEVVGQGLS